MVMSELFLPDHLNHYNTETSPVTTELLITEVKKHSPNYQQTLKFASAFVKEPKRISGCD